VKGRVSKAEGRISKARGSRFKETGNKIQVFSFRELRLFNGLRAIPDKTGLSRFCPPDDRPGPPVGSDRSPHRANQSSMTFDYQKDFSIGLSL
jgi:hypothetical protein